MGSFSFGGKTIVAPGILVSSEIGAQRVLQLLPFGKVAMIGAADGGSGLGTVYSFNDTIAAQRVLRKGPLLDALLRAAAAGASSGFVAVVIGAKTPSTLSLAGPAPGAATLTSGDQGSWTTGINVSIVAGTAANSVAVTFSYPDPLSGQTVYIGGNNSPFDNITLFSQLAAAIAKNSILTPPVSSGLPAIVTLAVTTDGLPAVLAKTPLAGGTGSGTQTLAFNDVKAGVDAMIDVNFDIGHLVGIYDLPSQAYADAQAAQVATLGRLRRWVHQVLPTGTANGQLKTVNSQAVASALSTAATSIDSVRSSVIAQQVGYTDPSTGTTTLVDAAPLFCGLASLKGATGANGPATPLTYETLPGALSVDFGVLRTTNDVDNAIAAGGIVLEQVGFGATAAVRIVQSVTTAPNDASGNPWIFGEFSVVRVSDALLANCIAALERGNPKTIGGGNTQAVKQAALSEVRDVLEDALQATWITDFDPASITLFTVGGTGEDDILRYSAAPTVPLNHIGIDQTLLPFQGPVALGGQVNG